MKTIESVDSPIDGFPALVLGIDYIKMHSVLLNFTKYIYLYCENIKECFFNFRNSRFTKHGIFWDSRVIWDLKIIFRVYVQDQIHLVRVGS